MPLLVARPVPPPPPPPPPSSQVRLVNYRWTSPTGQVLPMMHAGGGAGVVVLAGGDGLGAAPRTITRRSLATGGSMPRWSHAEERLVALPIRLRADEHVDLIDLRREVVRAFLATTPAAGTPTPGTLRVTRADGTWRELGAFYLDGLSWPDETVSGPLIDRTVLQLVACDPWWYGESVVALDFATAVGRDYFNPYETVSPDRALGAATVNVIGDVNVSPVWTITGPADSVTVRYEPAGPGWTFGQVDAGETITVNVETYTVTDNTGANRVGNIAWPTSTLFTLRPGDNDLLLSMTNPVAGQSSIRLTYRPRYETA